MKKAIFIKFQILLLLFVVYNGKSLLNENSNNPFTTILISLDGFRYDYLDRGVTPNLSRIAKEGVRAAYLQPVFPSSTFPNHISIITGLYPTNHGIVANKFFDTITKEIYAIGNESSANPKWYFGEPFWMTCKKNRVISASYFWPSSDLNDSSRNPNYFEKYQHNRDYLTRVKGVLSWLDLPQTKRPSFITLYFDSPDTYGHNSGTNSELLNKKLLELDSVLAFLIDGLKQRNIFDKTNLIIVSDHGMMDFSKKTMININSIIPRKYAEIINNSAYVLIYPNIGYDDSVRVQLAKFAENYTFYRTDSLPVMFNIGPTSRFGKFVAIANCGWIFSNNDDWNDTYVAAHGYDNRCLEMQGMFVARGPNFKQSYQSIGLRNIDIYPLLCKIFDFRIDHKIDGDLFRIEHILK